MIEGELIKLQVFSENETERLVLRELMLEDAPALLKHYSNVEAMCNCKIAPLSNLHEAEELIQSFHALFELGYGIRWGIFKKGDRSFIGTCGFTHWDLIKTHKAEIGYDLIPALSGNGFMGESLKWVIKYGFEILDLNRIEAFVDGDNYRAQNLYLDLGFQKEGLLRENNFVRGQFVDEICFSLLKRDWTVG